MSRLYLQRVRLNSGGYDSRGRYFGTGQPLYKWSTEFEGNDREGYVRGGTRAAALKAARAELVKYSQWPHSKGEGFGRPPRSKRRSSASQVKAQEKMQACARRWRKGESQSTTYRAFMKACLLG